MRFSRRFWRRSERGLSEIVGTLMLIVIVVAAVTLLAAFVASYEKTLTTQENYAHEQSLESIHILALNTTLNSTGTGFATFGFTLASASVNPSTIIGIFINSEPLSCFSWTNLDNGSKGQFSLSTANPNVGLSPFEELYVSTSLNPGPCYSFSLTGINPTPDHFVDLSVYTDLQNDFTRSFLPPVPLAVVSELNPSGNNPLTLLDGSQSFQPGGNVSLVNWVWNVSGGGSLVSTSTTLPSTFTDGGVSGVTNGALTTGTVTGVGTEATFTVPAGFTFGSGETLGFTIDTSLTVSSGCSITNSTIQPGATGTVSGTTLTVSFTFSTDLTGSGCTLSFASSGVTMTATPVSASGEEYEISPALPYFGPSQAPFIVTLGLTNSVGLDGTLVEQYLPPA